MGGGCNTASGERNLNLGHCERRDRHTMTAVAAAEVTAEMVDRPSQLSNNAPGQVMQFDFNTSKIDIGVSQALHMYRSPPS